jgi:hypothetical protein
MQNSKDRGAAMMRRLVVPMTLVGLLLFARIVGAQTYMTDDLARSQAIDACMEPTWNAVKKLRREITDCKAKNISAPDIKEGDYYGPRACLATHTRNRQLERQLLQTNGDACDAQVAQLAQQQKKTEQMKRESAQMEKAAADQHRKQLEDGVKFVEEQRRAEVERRREESQRAVNQAMRELTTARDRAEAYKEKAAGINTRNVDLTPTEMRALDDMRRRAEADGLRPRYVPAEPVASGVNGSSMTGAVTGLLGGEAESIIDWGLNRTEVGERFMEAWEMADDWQGKFDALVSTYQYARSAWNGTASYDDHSSAVVNGTSFLATKAFASTPAIAIQVSRVVTGVAGLHQAGLYQIQMLAASDRPLTSAEIAKLSDPRLPIQALFGPFLPLDRMHRIEQVWVEGSRFVDAGGFLTLFGR